MAHDVGEHNRCRSGCSNANCDLRGTLFIFTDARSLYKVLSSGLKRVKSAYAAVTAWTLHNCAPLCAVIFIRNPFIFLALQASNLT